MHLSLIAAMSENRVIGINGALPWHISDDLKRFRRLTEGHAIIMGRKTFESIGRPLPGRENIVLTRQDDFTAEGVTVRASLDAAFDHIRHGELPEGITRDVAFVIGGGELYRQALPLADTLHLTVVGGIIEGDTTFPAFDADKFIEVKRESHKGEPDYDFIVLEKRPHRAD